MAFAFVKQVQQFQVITGAATDVVTLTAGAAQGNWLTLLWEESGADCVLSSVTDSKGNTWAVTAQSFVAADGYASGIAYAYLGTALVSGDTITLTWSNTNFVYKFGAFMESSGGLAGPTASILDSNNQVGDTFATSASALSLTTVAASTMVWAIVAQQHAQVYTVGGSFTSAGTQTHTGPTARSDYLYRIVSAQGSYSPAGTFTADNYRGSIAAFKLASAGGGAVLSPIQTFGPSYAAHRAASI